MATESETNAARSDFFFIKLDYSTYIKLKELCDIPLDGTKITVKMIYHSKIARKLPIVNKEP